MNENASIASKIILMLLLLALNSAARSEIYICTSPAGQTKYQDSPCEDGRGAISSIKKTTETAGDETYCRAIQQLSTQIAQLMHKGVPSTLVYDELGAQTTLSDKEITSVVNYVYSYKAVNYTPYRIGTLSNGKCMTGNWIGPTKTTPPESISRSSTGTGFIITQDGHIITNNHVVEACETAKIIINDNKMEGTIVARSTELDLAVIKSDAQVNPPSFRINEAILGETISVAGFPLTGILSSDLNITNGIVSAVRGMRDESVTFQITAPTQPGNSGGPVLDERGNVIGIVVSKLSSLWTLARTRDLPQNVNFAIHASYAIEFLKQNGVRPRDNESSILIDTKATAAYAKGFVVALECLSSN